MDLETLRSALDAAPFRPFVLRLADGRALHVPPKARAGARRTAPSAPKSPPASIAPRTPRRGPRP
jgi:hypothetical protein